MNYGQNKDLYKELKKEETLKVSVNFGGSQEKLKSNYLDVYEGVYAEVISTDKFDEDTDLSTIYLGKVDMTRSTEVKAEGSFPITTRGYTKGQLIQAWVSPICQNPTFFNVKTYTQCPNLPLQLEEFK